MTKQALRAELKARRLAMAPTEVAAASRVIVDSLQGRLSDLKPQYIHCFEPLEKLHEVDVSPVLLWPNAKVFTSRLIDKKWQIVSVDNGEIRENLAFDVIIVPMLGFDENLQRIGYGGGYYDRLLATQPKAKKIGVCFKNGRLASIPAEAHDIPLDIIVTEEF